MYPDALRGGDKKQAVAEKLKERPLLIVFVLDGCGGCESNESAWKEAKTKAGVPTLEVESDAIPDGENVSAFPTMRMVGKDGKKKEIVGAKSSGDEILNELAVPKKKGGSHRRKTTRAGGKRNRLVSRKLRNRSLRRYISF